MFRDFTQRADSILERTVAGEPGVPGVVAMITDRTGNLYQGAAGHRVVGGEPMTLDTVFALFSTTKAITATAALQLVEEGSLDLDAPAREYAPAFGSLQVIAGFADDGEPLLRAPARPATVRQLLSHTAGMGYDFFNETYARLAADGRQPSIVAATREALMTPLLFDPGSEWEYGSNIDWLGQVIEAVSGKRLGDVFAERIFGPLDMRDTSFIVDDAMASRLAPMHQRSDDGSLTPNGLRLPSPPEIDMGGHGLHGTVGDYMKFIRMWLNDGRGEHGDVLRPETVQMATSRQLPEGLHVKMLPGVLPALSNDAEFFPGQPKSWSLAFMINEEPAPTGRPAGSQAWAGLANLFYWIDRKNGVGGYWATQILPFADAVSLGGYLELETEFYNVLKQ